GAIRAMDKLLIGKNISPGGCADLLALTVFLELLATAGDAAAVGALVAGDASAAGRATAAAGAPAPSIT
ncbi:MAG: triphosphoribosyl-dephospho-CoA synthase, partial [Coriobacteriia bacterium]